MMLKLVKRPRLKKKPNKTMSTYDLCLVYKSSHRKSITEKLGSFNVASGSFELNVFRLVYWLSNEVGASGNVLLLLERSFIIQLQI